MQVMFGSGIAWATPLQDATGATITSPTPVKMAALQEVSVEFGNTTKPLFAQYQFPIAIGRGTGTIQGKAKWAQINGREFNNMYFGQTLSAGIFADVQDLVGALATSTGVTPTVPNSGTWQAPLEVRDSNGVPLARSTAALPSTGQYTVSAGTYVFNTSQSGITVFIDFQYTATSTSAYKIAIVNQQLGVQPVFQADLSVLYNNKAMTLSLLNCVGGKLTLQTKLDDFTIPDFDFQAFANGAGQLGTISFSE